MSDSSSWFSSLYSALQLAECIFRTEYAKISNRHKTERQTVNISVTTTGKRKSILLAHLKNDVPSAIKIIVSRKILNGFINTVCYSVTDTNY